MRTDPALTLAQWFSPSFPVGAFAYSHGLESAIQSGELASAADLQTWLEALLETGTGRNDAILIAHAACPDADLDDLHDLCLALCNAAGRVTETVDQGVAFARTLRALGHDIPDRAYPVAVGHGAAVCGLPVDMVVRFFLHAFSSNLISAAVRAVPLGQSEGQQVLARLQPRIEAQAHAALSLTLDDLWSNTFRADIAAMQHETLYSRVFRT